MEVDMGITGKLYCSMMISAANHLDNNKEETNNLNVFPVPDGDTGTNMSLTMSTIVNAGEISAVGDAAEKIAGLMLRSARGNSGAILSLFFRGMGKALRGLADAGAKELVSALERGTVEAYRAVMKPTEGTILTVMRVCSEDARSAYDANNSITLDELVDLVVKSAEETLSKTPEMLPVLKQAGVVDAGGYGFVLVLRGMRSAYFGQPVENLNKPVVETAVTVSEGANFADFDTDSIEFGYCTECIIDKNEKYLGEDTSGELYEFIKSIGDSAVFVDDESIIKLHIHTNDPGAVLTRAIDFGALASVKIENMRTQHTNLSGGAAKEAPSKNEVKIEKKYGFVSVCMGEGIAAMFRDIGVDTIIEGGQTMNPSTQDIIDAVMKTPAEYVYILPNNKNISMVAKQASEIVTERHVIVLPTESVPQGISAMIAFNPDADVDVNTKEMKFAYELVTSMSVTYAVRDTEIDRFTIKKGQFLGLVENKIACVTDTSEACVKQLTRGMTGASFVTVFYGENVTDEDAERVAGIISAKVGGACEVAMLPGGQPIYDYVISVETL